MRFGITKRRELAVVNGALHFAGKAVSAEIVLEEHDDTFICLEESVEVESQALAGLPEADSGLGFVVANEMIAEFFSIGGSTNNTNVVREGRILTESFV